MSDVAIYGERFVDSDLNTAAYSDKIARFLKPVYDDYEIAKMHIMQAVGDLTDFDLFRNQLLVGVFIPPNVSPTGWHITVKEQKEWMWQGKASLVLKLGPGAFQSTDDGFHDTMLGLLDADGDLIPGSGRTRRVKVGDWIWTNANAGIQVHVQGTGASRPQGLDSLRRAIDIFAWEGWSCRVVSDEAIFGRLANPQSVV